MPVAVCQQPKIFLRRALSRRGEFCDRAERRRLGLLAAGVGIDFGVEDEHVDIAVAGEHVIEAAVTDVVGPAVAAQQPDTFRDEIIGEYFQAPRLGRVHGGQLLTQ